jgi:hypothetical protein
MLHASAPLLFVVLLFVVLLFVVLLFTDASASSISGCFELDLKLNHIVENSKLSLDLKGLMGMKGSSGSAWCCLC